MKWFIRKGIFYQPVSLMGWMILVFAVVGSVFMFTRIDSTSHSASDTIRNWLLSDLLIAAVYTLVGYLTSGGKESE
ncbi:MAG: hypothetical protein JSS79_01985 [Bacteroidetes bacterium]|nr:hypothetical protein [Bacteroidota bacterium]